MKRATCNSRPLKSREGRWFLTGGISKCAHVRSKGNRFLAPGKPLEGRRLSDLGGEGRRDKVPSKKLPANSTRLGRGGRCLGQGRGNKTNESELGGRPSGLRELVGIAAKKERRRSFNVVMRQREGLRKKNTCGKLLPIRAGGKGVDNGTRERTESYEMEPIRLEKIEVPGWQESTFVVDESSSTNLVKTGEHERPIRCVKIKKNTAEAAVLNVQENGYALAGTGKKH